MEWATFFKANAHTHLDITAPLFYRAVATHSPTRRLRRSGIFPYLIAKYNLATRHCVRGAASIFPERVCAAFRAMTS